MICPHCNKQIDQGKTLMEVFNVNKQNLAIQAETLYAAYPRKVGRGAALPAIQRALRKVSYDALMTAIKSYATQWAGRDREEMKYCPHPATWFNQERWADEPEEIVEYAPAEAKEEEANLF